MNKIGVMFLVALTYSQSIFANQPFSPVFSSTNVQALRGSDYEVGDSRRNVFTIEHFSKWQWGDVFVFGDYSQADDDVEQYYIEPTVRFAIDSLFNNNTWISQWISGLYVAAQIEKPKNQDTRHLLGVSVDLPIPNMNFFQASVFFRDNPNLSGGTHQITLVWQKTFVLYKRTLMFEGFMDMVGREDTSHSYLLTAPRVLLDIGEMLNMVPDKLWLGFEWQYWRNKFGIQGVNESAPQLQVKIVL